MSIYSQAEYDALKTAYLDLLSGEKVVQASIGGKFVRYQDSQIPYLKTLLSTVGKELGLIPSRALAKPKGRFD
ncbi:MAG: hypothetical protein GY868_16035 [Deltaproteobacteria bacterium]|nr:hypothetical protein [Deltaproteobacteria bacterium]